MPKVHASSKRTASIGQSPSGPQRLIISVPAHVFGGQSVHWLGETEEATASSSRIKRIKQVNRVILNAIIKLWVFFILQLG